MALLGGFEAALGVPPRTLRDMFDGGDFGTIRLLHYPGDAAAAEGSTGIGAHTDEEQDPSSPIVCLSLYANPQHSRPLTIKPSKHYRGAGGPVEIEDIELADGSLYALMPPTNEWWRHELKPRTCTRVSITFRRDRPPINGGGDEQRRDRRHRPSLRYLGLDRYLG